MTSIGEILAAKGRALADARRERANVWTPTVQQLANLPGQIMQDRAAEREAAARAAQQAQDAELARQERQQRIDEGKQRLNKGTRDEEDDQALTAIFSAPGILDETGTVDIHKAIGLAQQHAPRLLPRLMEAAQKHDEGVQQAALRAAQIAGLESGQRQTANAQGVRRMIGESITARNGQPLTPQDRQTYQGMALQEGIELPKELIAEPVEKVDTRALNVQLADAIKRGDRPAMNAIRQAMNEAAAAGRDPNAGPRTPVWVIDKEGNFRDLAGVAPPGSKPANTREQGRPVTSGDAGRMADFDTGIQDIDVLGRALSGNKATGTSAYVGAEWVPNFVSEYTGWGVDAKSKNAVIKRVKQVIGKTLEGGVLRKEDEEKYKDILPTISDPEELVKTKLDGLAAAIQRKKQNLVDELSDAGYDVSATRDRMNAAPAGVPTVGSTFQGGKVLKVEKVR